MSGGLRSGIAALALAGALSAQAETQETPTRPVSDVVATRTQLATTGLMTEVGSAPIVVAQAAPPESDGKPYYADVLQIDKKTTIRVTYFRNKRGAIIPPPIVDGKLVDGSPAPADPIDAKIAQKQVLVPYDKNAQIALAVVGDRDLMKEAGTYITSFGERVESGKTITRSDFETYLFHSYIYIESGSKGEGFMKLADHVSTAKLKLTSTEYTTMKAEAQAKAKRIWKATTGAVA